jgi:hypothetical protein
MQAIVWLRKAAEQGSARAQSALGDKYANGVGVPQDYGQAVVWLRKAAEQGDAYAQNNLGAMYLNGIGVPLDFQVAYVLFSLAGSHADGQTVNENAARLLSEAAKQLSPSQVEEAKALVAEWKTGMPLPKLKD